MMTKCPECGSTEIASDLIVYSKPVRHAGNEIIVVHVGLEDPTHKEQPLLVGFRAAICTDCGHTNFYTKRFAELKETIKKGFVNREI